MEAGKYGLQVGKGKKNQAAPQIQGFLPPQAIELEEAVIGGLLLDKDGIRTAVSILKDDKVFYNEAHQKVFRAAKDLFVAGHPVDMLTVIQKLSEVGILEAIGGPHFVASLSMKVISSVNLEYHCTILNEQFTKRKIIQDCAQVQQMCYDTTSDVFELVDILQKTVNSLHDTLAMKKAQVLSDLVTAAIDKIGAGIGQKGLTGVPSGLASMDAVTGGWQPSDLIILAARPAAGKTSVALQAAKKAAINFEKPVAFFSLEMSALQLTTKLISSEAEVTSNELSKSKITMDELKGITARISPLYSKNLLIDDTPGLSINEFRAKATKMKADHGIELIIVDYLQLMTGDKSAKGTREQEIAAISRGLKLVAKELNIPVIALSQLSRAVESRPDKRPMLSDLRESGSIEQDADMVIFLYRPEYYGITEDEMGNSTINTVTHIIAKHRNGPVCDVVTGCNMAYGKVYDLNAYNMPAAPAPDFNVQNLPSSQFEPEPDSDLPF